MFCSTPLPLKYMFPSMNWLSTTPCSARSFTSATLGAAAAADAAAAAARSPAANEMEVFRMFIVCFRLLL